MGICENGLDLGQNLQPLEDVFNVWNGELGHR